MKISSRTLNILKNFSSIHESIIIPPGNMVFTGRGSDLSAIAKTEEEFPNEIRIHKLGSFIAAMGQFDGAEVDFQEKAAIIRSGRTRTTYKYASKEIIRFNAKPTSVEKLQSMAIPAGNLKTEDLTAIKKMAAALELKNISVIFDGQKLMMKVGNKGRDGNAFEIGLSLKFDYPESFNCVFGMHKLIMLQDNYEVSIIPNKVIVFTGSIGVTYCVGFEVDNRAS